MVYFLNKLELSYQKYRTNGNVRDNNYKGKLLFAIKDFVSFVQDCKYRLCSNCLQYGFIMYNDKVIIRKRYVIPPIPNYMIPVGF